MGNTNAFLVGYADRVITPAEPIPLGGYGDTSGRFSERVLEDLHAISVAFRDETGKTVVFVTMDTTRAYFQVVPEARERISREAGLPMESIMITCTHTHSGPDMTNEEEPSVQRYQPVLVDHLCQAAKAALADLLPARIFVGDVEATGLNFVKHYKHTEPDGTVKFFGDNFGTQVLDGTTRHATDADPTMHLIRFQREGGKDVILANWRAHPQLTGGYRKGDMSADYPGAFRNVLAAQLGCHVLYLQGACGNINPKSRIKEENYTLDHNIYGARLAYFAVKCLENNMKEIPAGLIQTKQVIFTGEVNHTLDHVADKADEIIQAWLETKDRALCARMGAPYGITSYNHALGVRGKAKMEKTLDLELNAISVGEELAFVTAPNELFDTNSMYTEENSPFGMTFTCGYANGHWFYVPSQFGFDYGCYESHICRLMPGSGEKIADTFLEMLRELKQ